MAEHRENPENLRPFRFRTGEPTADPERVHGRAGIAHPVLVAAFEGWNDAGEAASLAAERLAHAWDAAPFAEIDPEEFYDFTEARPEINVVDGHVRSVTWPGTVFSIAPGPVDIVVVRGQEPQLHWRAYCDAFLELTTALEVERAILLGAYLGEVTHRGPVELTVTTTDPDLIEGERLAPTYYDGPTGIIGVLGAALAEADIPVVSLWANVPVYSVTVAAKAALSLAETTARLARRSADLGGLARRAIEYEQLLEELVATDENVAGFVERIEAGEADGTVEFSPERLTEEIERFLRDKRGG